jgi:hypothetical protein
MTILLLGESFVLMWIRLCKVIMGVQFDTISCEIASYTREKSTFIVQTFYNSKFVTQGQRNYGHHFSYCDAHSRNCVMSMVWETDSFVKVKFSVTPLVFIDILLPHVPQFHKFVLLAYVQQHL